MLTRITTVCRMGCKHCMINATPDGEHMSMDTFIKALEFSARLDPALFFISGGEPTDHPQFLEFAKIAKEFKNKGKIICILIGSNGMFLENEDYTHKILELNLPFQITNDPQFYPKKIKMLKHRNLVYENKLRVVSPFGRAVTNKITCSADAPLCFNFRSVCYLYQNLELALFQLRSLSKMCTPSVNVNGAVVAGESSGCYQIGTIASSNTEIIHNLNCMKCGFCGLHKKLSGRYKNQWEEMEQH